MTAAAPRVPEGLRDLMKGFTKEVLREKPNNIYDFSLNYFETLLEKSDDYTVKDYEQPISFENIYRARDCNRVPAALVFKIIPETLTELIKEFIKAVLRENPQNICEFGVKYFRSLHKTTVKNEDMQYTKYDNFFKNKDHLSLTPYAKCTCGRPFLLTGEPPEQRLGRDIKGFPKETSADKACLTTITRVEKTSEVKSVNKEINSNTKNTPIANSQRDVNDEVYLNAIYVIQRFFRNWLKVKHTKANGTSGESNPDNFKISEEAAAVIIQRSIRKLFAKKLRQSLNPYPVIPALTNIQHQEENNDNVSEAASYTSASTVRMSAESAAETIEMDNSGHETIISDEQTVSQTIIEVDEQQNERAAELDRQTENTINSPKGRAKDMTEVGEEINLNLPTREIETINLANNQPENVNVTLIGTKDESSPNTLTHENMKAMNTEMQVKSLQMDPKMENNTSYIEEKFIDPRLVNTSPYIHFDDSSQENIFASMASNKIEILKSSENIDTVSGNCSKSNQEFEIFNTTNKPIVEDDEKDVNNSTKKSEGLLIDNNSVIEENSDQSKNDELVHNIKKRHIEDQNLVLQEHIHNDEADSESFESQRGAFKSISTDDTEEGNIFQNANNVSSKEVLKEVKMCNSENSAQLKIDQEGCHVSTISKIEDEPATENVLTDVEKQKENIPTETSQAIMNVEPLDDLLNQSSMKEAIETKIDSFSTEKQDPELIKNSPQIKNNDHSPTETPANASLEVFSHQVSQEVEETDKNRVTETKNDEFDKIKTEISTEEFQQYVFEISIEPKEIISHEKPLRQVSQEEEQYEKVINDASVKDSPAEINNNDKISVEDSDQNNVCIESTQVEPAQENILHEENGAEKINFSSTYGQFSNGVITINQINHKDSSQTHIATDLNKEKSLEELSQQVSKEAEEAEINCAVEADLGDEQTKDIPNNKILQQTSDDKHKIEKIYGIDFDEKDTAESNTETQISGKDKNQNQISVESSKPASQDKVSQEDNGNDIKNKLSNVKQDSITVKTTEQISENGSNQTEISIESNADRPPEELLDKVLQEANETDKNDANATKNSAKPSNSNLLDESLHQVSEEDSNNGELDTTASRDDDMTKINNKYQTSKEDSSLTIESTHTSTQDKLLHEVSHKENEFHKNCSISNSKKESIEDEKANQTEIPTETNEVNQQVESPANIEDNLAEINNFDQNSDKEPCQTKTIMESSQTASQREILNEISEGENDTDKRKAFGTLSQDSIEINKPGQINDKHLKQTEIPTKSIDANPEGAQYEGIDAAVLFHDDSTEINNTVQSSDKTQLSVESSKSALQKELLHKVSQEDDGKKDSLRPIEQHSTEHKNIAQINENGTNEVIIPLEVEKPDKKGTIETENLVESTKAKTVEEIVQQEKYNQANVDVTKIGEHEQTEINNNNQSSKIDSDDTRMSDQLSPITPQEVLLHKDSQEDSDTDRIVALSTDKADPITRETKPPKGIDQVSDKEQITTEISELNTDSSLEEQLDQVLQDKQDLDRNETVGVIKNDSRSLEQIHEKSLNQTHIAPESNKTTDVDELLQQVRQVKEESIAEVTVKGDFTEISHFENGVKENDKEDSLNHSNITSDESMIAKLDNLVVAEREVLNDQASSRVGNNIDPYEMLVDAYESGETVILRKEIGFESVYNEVQRAKRSVNDVQTISESSEIETKKEVFEEVSKETGNELNNEYIRSEQSYTNNTDSETCHEKDLGAKREDFNTDTGNKDTNLLNSRNEETDINKISADIQKIGPEETDSILHTSAGLVGTTSTKDVDTAHDTSTASTNSPIIGTKNPFKNINRIDISENSNSKNPELNNSVEIVSNFKGTSELATVEEHKPSISDMNLNMSHEPNDAELHPSEKVGSLKSLKDHITAPEEELKSLDMKTKADDNSKDLDCKLLEQDDTKLKPRPENERTATYMYGFHKARQISSQASKSLRKTPTLNNITLLGNHTESLKPPRHTNQQSASIECNIKTENKDEIELAPEESTVASLACETISFKTINANSFPDSKKPNGTKLEKLELYSDLDSNNNNVMNEIDLETPTKLFAALNIFDNDEKVQNIIVETSNKRLHESNYNMSPDPDLNTEDLNSDLSQSFADDPRHDCDSEHSRTSSSGVLKTIIELNESETPRKSEFENTSNEQTSTTKEDDSQMKKHEMIDVLNEPYDLLELGSGSDNDSEFTNSWTCSKETDENVLSDEFMNEIYNEIEPLHVNKSRIDEAGSTLQGGIYEMNPYDNTSIDSTNPSLSVEKNSNESHEKNDLTIETVADNINIREKPLPKTSEIVDTKNDLNKKYITAEGAYFAQDKSSESNSELDSPKPASVHESLFKESNNDQSGTLEPSMEKLEMYENKQKSFFIEEAPSPEIKSSHDSSENFSSETVTSETEQHSENLGNVSNVSENQSNINENDRESKDVTLPQEEIEDLITPSQSAAANEHPLVARGKTPNKRSKNELNKNKVDFETENINPSFVQKYSSKGQREPDTNSAFTNMTNKDEFETASLLDKSAIVIQSAYKKYNSKKLSSDHLTSVKNNAAKVIQNLFRNYYAKKTNSHFIKVPNVSNAEELTNIEESPPTHVEIISQGNLNADINSSISNERTNDVKYETHSSPKEEFTKSSLGHNKEHKIEWFVGDEPIVRSIPDNSTPLNIICNSNALQQVVVDDSLVDVALQHSNLNNLPASSEPATSPSINSIETVKVNSTSSLLEPDSISLSTNSKLTHSDGTVSAEEMNAGNISLKAGEETTGNLSYGDKVFGSSNEEIDEDANKKTRVEKHLQQDVSPTRVISPKNLENDFEKDATVIKTCEGETPLREIKCNEKFQVTTPQSELLSPPGENNEVCKEFKETQKLEGTSRGVSNINSEDKKLESEINVSSEALRLATEFLNLKSSDDSNMSNSLTEFLDLERKYWESNILYMNLEKPCIKKCVSLKDKEKDASFLETNNNVTTPSDKSNASDKDAVDSLEASTEKLRKTDAIIEKMQKKYAAESRVNSGDERLSVEGNFEEPIIKTMKELQDTLASAADEDEIVVMKPLQREITRESSEQSDSVIFGSEDDTKNAKEAELVKASLRRLYTIPGDDANVLFKTVTIDKTVKYIEPPESETAGTSDSNSFCLDEDTSENIRQKMMAYSLSEADSDFLGAETRDGSGSIDKSSISRDDFNITTALEDLEGTSTETESTIVSAATKIQAGARGFLTRRRLRRASVGTKTSLPENNKASFGNAAIDESLERLIEEEAAKKIQSAYRKHYRQGKNSFNAKNGHEDKTSSEVSESVVCMEYEINTFSSFESSLAARRHTLQRGDAMHNDSVPDEENILSPDSDRTSKSIAVATKKKPTISKETSGEAVTDNGKKINNQLKWIALRQNSMPVQIESEIFRVIPKHMRKRIKSAGGENKRRMRILKD